MTITEMPNVEVTAPALQPYPFGLFSTAPSSLDPRAGEGGVWWRSVSCGQGVGITFGRCQVDDVNSIEPLDPNVACIISNAFSFTVYAASDETMGPGATTEQKFARAREVLLGGEQFVVEGVLWDALVAATTVEVASWPSNPVEAVAAAEAYAPSVYGGTPVIHMNRQSAVLAAAGTCISASGGRLSTVLGTPVVAGGGYGDVPDSNAGDIIVTGGLVVARGEVFDMGQTFDRKINAIAAVVERTYVVGWDCFAARVEYAAA